MKMILKLNTRSMRMKSCTRGQQIQGNNRGKIIYSSSCLQRNSTIKNFRYHRFNHSKDFTYHERANELLKYLIIIIFKVILKGQDGKIKTH